MSDHHPMTMKDIARHFGVSVATVSRALAGNAHISEGRRAAIQAYAREHHFRPNAMAGSLRNQSAYPQRVIGVVVPKLVHEYFPTVLAGIEAVATRRGYRIVVACDDERYESEVRICRDFAENNVCGVIVSQAKDTTSYEHFQELIDQGIPLVFYDRICTGIEASRVVADDYAGAFAAVSHLVATGCRRIAYYNAPINLEISKNRFNGYKDALLRAGIGFDEALVFACDNRADAERLTPSVLGMERRPDAFFAVCDDAAIGILHATKRLGLRVPDDVSICGFANGYQATACDPMLTTVDQRGEQVGQEAATILIGQLEGTLPRDKAQRRVVRTQLIVRGTTRQPH